MRKRLICLLLVAALALGLTACGETDTKQTESTEKTENTAGTGQEFDEAHTLKLGMAGKDIKTACIIVAQELGLFAEEGVQVEFETISNLADGLTAVDTGKLDMLPFGVIPTATFVSQGVDVVIVGGTISEGSEAITLPENADAYQSPGDFKGKKIGCYRMETGHMVLKGMLREAGLDLEKDVEFVLLDSSASICEAVKKGEVDVGFVNSGYGEIAKQNDLAVSFYVGDWQPDFPCCRQTVSRKTLDEKRDALVSFMVACLRAYEIYQNDHETTIAALCSYSGQSEEYVEAVMYHGAMKISLDPNTDKVDAFYQVMKANGDIDPNTPYELRDHVDASIYYDALQVLLEREPDNAIMQQLLAEYAENNT